MEPRERVQDATTGPDDERVRLEAELKAIERRIIFLRHAEVQIEQERKAIKSSLYKHQLAFSVLGGYGLGTSFGLFYQGRDPWMASSFLLAGLVGTTISGIIMWWRMKL